ncbi:MAG: hypothetical protein AAFV27_06255, partial [Pseudomonadota bacterium]
MGETVFLPRDLEEAGSRMVLGNTYHLHLRPGEEIVERLGGEHVHFDAAESFLDLVIKGFDD